MSTFSVESITESFTTPSIPRVSGEPTRKTIKDVEKKVITNAAHTPCELGGGGYGFLGVVLIVHITIAGYVFQPFQNPGAPPILLPNATQHQILQRNATHEEALIKWRQQNAVTN